MTTESGKKARELAGLRFLYDEHAYWSSIYADAPDFVLQTHTSTSAPFGVEITEIHPSASAARLMHMPGYLTHLTRGGGIRHKGDAHLKIGPVEFTSPDGQTVTGGAVERDNMTLDQYITALAGAIATKDPRRKAIGLDSAT